MSNHNPSQHKIVSKNQPISDCNPTSGWVKLKKVGQASECWVKLKKVGQASESFAMTRSLGFYTAEVDEAKV